MSFYEITITALTVLLSMYAFALRSKRAASRVTNIYRTKPDRAALNERRELMTLRRRRCKDKKEIRRLRALVHKKDIELINLAARHNEEFTGHETYKARHRIAESNLKAARAQVVKLREQISIMVDDG